MTNRSNSVKQNIGQEKNKGKKRKMNSGREERRIKKKKKVNLRTLLEKNKFWIRFKDVSLKQFVIFINDIILYKM